MKALLRGLLVVSVSTVSLALFLPGAPGQVPAPDVAVDVWPGIDTDFDAREGSLAPSAEQEAIAAGLGAHVTWNRFGTPQSLIKYGGFLATGLSLDPEAAARQFVEANSGLFRLSPQEAAGLEVLNVSPFAQSRSRAVIFRQRYGDLAAAQDGLITVGLNEGRVAYVSSSAAGNQGTPGAATLSATEAWSLAATEAGLAAGAITDVGQDFEWTTFKSAGLSGTQRVRLKALPMYVGAARPAYEVVVLDHSIPEAYMSFVDAQTGKVWWRQSLVDEFAEAAVPQAAQFNGTYVAPACGPFHGPYTAPPGTVQIDVYAQGVMPEDIVLELHHPQGTIVASSDIPVGDNPEVIHYAPGGPIDPGDYFVRVCPFSPTQVPPATQYVGAIVINDAASVNLPYPPKWKVFKAYPNPDLSNTDIREVWCWEHPVAGSPVAECQREVRNLAARVPWDLDARTGQPTFTTIGNAANSAEAWLNPLAPGEGQGIRPVANDRRYIYPWQNIWQTSKCNPTVLAPPGIGNDIQAATINLFAMHNRMHDWTYFLGFTEQNSNGQLYNFGNTMANRENDQELGGAQAGAVTGGFPVFLGRNNANQTSLPDGAPGVTNMYLWQPVAGSWYGPCVDGDYDMAVIGHEYTHWVSNRMVAGPDTGLSGSQAGQMGESWGDLNGAEIMQEYGFAPVQGENPFATGAYVTGNHQAGIRNYGMNNSPLNYSNIGYDYVVAENQVHANGEIWSATNFTIRQTLVNKYNAQFPASDAALQYECAEGEHLGNGNPVFPRHPDNCPGNRRWSQIMHDAFLLMPSTTSMLDARDAYLAADVLRFDGDNQVELWDAFARRGMGEFAFSNTNNDNNPKPSFESPEVTDEATITFTATAPDEGAAAVTNASIYVGQYHHRITPIGDTDPANDGNPPGPGENILDNVAKFVPGTYDFTVRAPGYGIEKFTRTFAANEVSNVNFSLPTNWASTTKGATGSGDGSPIANLLDDSEGTTWARTGGVPTVAGTQVTVDLAGGVRRVGRVHVSAAGTTSRYTPLRQFEIWTCNDTSANCALPTSFTKIFTSPANAFPGSRPRPTTPALILRGFNVPPTDASHVRLVVLTNQCSGTPEYTGAQNPTNDPNVPTDCIANSANENTVVFSELEVFGPRCRITSRPTSIPCNP